jgi:hypothetical protein
MATTALQLITKSAYDIGAIAIGDSLESALAQDGLSRLNAMLNAWIVQPLTIPAVIREVFSITANQSTYTIGPGGDFNTTRPTMLTGASLLLNTSSPSIEIPITVMTDDMYQAITIKTQTNTLFTAVYLNTNLVSASYALAQIFVWPVPTTAANDLVLYRPEQITSFANLTTQYTFPPGYEEAMEYNLARRLSTPWGRELPAEIDRMARESLAWVKRQNYKLSDLPNDAARAISSTYGYYNINSDTGGRAY